MEKHELAQMVAHELAAAQIETNNAKNKRGIVEFTLKEVGYQLATLVFMVSALWYLGMDNRALIAENNNLKINALQNEAELLTPVTFSPFKILDQDYERINCDNGLIQSVNNVNFCQSI